ncbi:hypothetical protein HZB04_00220, partial [Candidatus Wolfebacteria bacterium]|nr:hypothetical protein [Candidatus Wolfebacteria bacterium]
MSFTSNGVKLNKRTDGFFSKWLLKASEFILSVLFIVSLAGPIVFPNNVQATAGVSKILSYQGRLTDNNGAPVTDGTRCFRFSIYDEISGGAKLWPSGAPLNSTSTINSGVFNVGVGDTSVGGDSLSSYVFSGNDTQYLNVEIYSIAGSSCTGGSFEILAPRQRIDAVAYARVAEEVYGPSLKTSSTQVQVGAGTGSASPILLNLDWKNTSDTIGGTCSPNGAIWYNSNTANKTALVCNNGSIMYFGTTSTISGIKEQSTSTPIVSGTVNFSGSNNITISQTGNTLQFSVSSQSVQTQNVQALAASGIAQTFTSGTVQFSAGNLITLSTGAQAIIVSNLLSSATTVSAIASANAIGAMASRFALEGHQHAGVGAIGVSGAASTAGNTATTFGTWYFMPGGNITLSQVTGAAGVHSLSISAGGGGGGVAISAGTQSGNTGTIIFSNSNNLSFGMAGSLTITGSFSQSVQTQNLHNITISSNTAGVGAAISSGTLTLAGGANITLSQNAGNAITIIGGGGGGGIAGFAVNALTTYTSGTVVLSAGNNITLGTNGQTITISAPAGGGGGGVTISHWPEFPVGLAASTHYTGATAAGTNITGSFHVAPLLLD